MNGPMLTRLQLPITHRLRYRPTIHRDKYVSGIKLEAKLYDNDMEQIKHPCQEINHKYH
jgi:hypothetical protein